MDRIGCFTRPWFHLDTATALAGMQAAGYRTAGLMRLLSADTSESERDALLRQLADHGLTAAVNMIDFPLEDVDAGARRLRAEIDQAAAAGIPHLLWCGTSRPELYENAGRVVREAMPHAEASGVVFGIKPHGGISTTALDLVRFVEAVGSPACGVWYDAGNLIHYHEEPPERDLERLAPLCVGMCVKDIRGGLKGDVNIEPGTGDIDFPPLFAALRQGGFTGPCVVECVGGSTPEEIAAAAGRTRERLQAWLA